MHHFVRCYRLPTILCWCYRATLDRPFLVDDLYQWCTGEKVVKIYCWACQEAEMISNHVYVQKLCDDQVLVVHLLGSLKTFRACRI